MKREIDMEAVLAGDIGGTKTNLGFFVGGADRPERLVVRSYPSTDASSLEALIERFLSEFGHTVSSACFGIAGPVVQGAVKATNLPWEISEEALSRRFGFRNVHLVNDLTATSYAVPLLRSDEVVDLTSATGDRSGNIGVVAPGTGLGVALLVAHERGFIAVASEGGHADFAPADERQVGLWRYLQKDLEHVSYERVVSGPGLYATYEWLRQASDQPEPAWLTARLQREEPPKVISEVGLAARDAVCTDALDMFVFSLGAYAGNLALTAMTRGGIYLGGGIPPKILPRLKEGPFMEAFTAKGRFREILSGMPVRVILNDEAALLGAAWRAQQSDGLS